jgi:hypothetical protein
MGGRLQEQVCELPEGELGPGWHVRVQRKFREDRPALAGAPVDDGWLEAANGLVLPPLVLGAELELGAADEDDQAALDGWDFVEGHRVVGELAGVVQAEGVDAGDEDAQVGRGGEVLELENGPLHRRDRARAGGGAQAAGQVPRPRVMPAPMGAMTISGLAERARAATR